MNQKAALRLAPAVHAATDILETTPAVWVMAVDSLARTATPLKLKSIICIKNPILGRRPIRFRHPSTKRNFMIWTASIA